MEHAPSKGDALEQSVREFLRKYLPVATGVGSGVVMDSNGSVSKQLDVILFDEARTPRLFSSPDNSVQVLPAEGVVGVVEVKTRLSKSDLLGVVNNMKSVKRLEKRAYFRQDLPAVIQHDVRMYGQTLRHFPIVYSLFAVEVDGEPANLVASLDELQQSLPIHQRIDNLCILNSGVGVNHHDGQSISVTPTPGTAFGYYPTTNALLLWFVLLAGYVLQAETEPINLVDYLGRGFTF